MKQSVTIEKLFERAFKSLEEDNHSKFEFCLRFLSAIPGFKLKDYKINFLVEIYKNNSLSCYKVLEDLGAGFTQEDAIQLISIQKYNIAFFALQQIPIDKKFAEKLFNILITNISYQTNVDLNKRLFQLTLAFVRKIRDLNLNNIEIDLEGLNKYMNKSSLMFIREFVNHLHNTHFKGVLAIDDKRRPIACGFDSNNTNAILAAENDCLVELDNINQGLAIHKKGECNRYPINYLFRLLKPDLGEKEKAALLRSILGCFLAMRGVKFETLSLLDLRRDLSLEDANMIHLMIIRNMSPVYSVEIPNFDDKRCEVLFRSMCRYNQMVFNTMILPFTWRVNQNFGPTPANLLSYYEVNYLANVLENYYGGGDKPSNPLHNACLHQVALQALSYAGTCFLIYYHKESLKGADIGLFSMQNEFNLELPADLKAQLMAKLRADETYNIEIPSL